MSRRVLITGAGSGLGRELALAYARRGDCVAVVDIRLERANETCALLAAGERPHLALAADVGSDASMLALRESIEQHWDGLEILVNNAGVASGGAVWQTETLEWERVNNVNLMGVVRGCNLFVPLLLRRSGGLVINTASFAGLAGAPELGAYGVSKAAVVALSEGLRAELHPHGARVSVLCPSFFQTRLTESCAPGQERIRDLADRMMSKGPLSAEQVAAFTIKFSEKGRFLLLPHRDTRYLWWLKRHWPGAYFSAILRFASRVLGDEKAGG